MGEINAQDSAALRQAIADLKARLPLVPPEVAEDLIDVLVDAQRMLNCWGTPPAQEVHA